MKAISAYTSTGKTLSLWDRENDSVLTPQAHASTEVQIPEPM